MTAFNDYVDCTPAERRERWEQCLRVLSTLPEHERTEHWNMSVWAQRTTCGTIACAAGHCGMDPWFIDQGFLVIPVEPDSKPCSPIGDANVDGMPMCDAVKVFFGEAGCDEIFLESSYRSVDAVIQEVKDFIDTQNTGKFEDNGVRSS